MSTVGAYEAVARDGEALALFHLLQQGSRLGAGRGRGPALDGDLTRAARAAGVALVL